MSIHLKPYIDSLVRLIKDAMESICLYFFICYTTFTDC